MLDLSAIANSVKAEVERQQVGLDYDALTEVELQRVIANLESRLDLCKNAIASRSAAVPATAEADVDAPAAKEAPKMVAKKSEGNWPDLPWGVAGKQDAQKIHDYLEKNMQERIMIIDGAMGTTIQQYKFTEEDFRGAPARLA